MEWFLASDIQKRIKELALSLGFSHVDPRRVFCFRSFGSRSRARARIWSFPRIWQKALKTKPSYCIEVLSEKFDHLAQKDRDKILIHELLHIPKNFSGSLLSHKGRNRQIDTRAVEKIYRRLKSE